VTPSGGTGATFNTATFTPLTLSVTTGGAYSTIPASPASVTGGSGLTAILDFGIGNLSLTNAGTLYTNDYTPVTVSFGNAQLAAIMDTATRVLTTGYLIDSKMLDIPDSPNKRYIYTLMAKPPTQFSEPEMSFEFPALFYIKSGNNFQTPAPGVDYDIYPHRRGRFTALQVDTYATDRFTDLPDVFYMLSPGNGSKIFPIPGNCAHGSIFWETLDSGGQVGYTESIPASTEYIPGQSVTVSASQKRLLGTFWKKTVVTVRERS